jgi:hypothetical protein
MSADDPARWKDELAKRRRQQRARRWKRKTPAIGPGMLRVTTVRAGEKDGPDGGQSRAPTGNPPAA